MLILNAADLVAQSKKSEDLYYALESHAVLYEVDGQKYDFNRCVRKLNVLGTQHKDESSLALACNKNMLIQAIKAINKKEFLNLRILSLVDELFYLRRDKYIK